MPGTKDTRDRRAMAAVACPVCRARPGEMCHVGDVSGPRRLHGHSERRQAYREWRDAQPPGTFDMSGRGPQHGA